MLTEMLEIVLTPKSLPPKKSGVHSLSLFSLVVNRRLETLQECESMDGLVTVMYFTLSDKFEHCCLLDCVAWTMVFASACSPN